jgi:hypothetical protein
MMLANGNPFPKLLVASESHIVRIAFELLFRRARLTSEAEKLPPPHGELIRYIHVAERFRYMFHSTLDRVT